MNEKSEEVEDALVVERESNNKIKPYISSYHITPIELKLWVFFFVLFVSPKLVGPASLALTFLAPQQLFNTSSSHSFHIL